MGELENKIGELLKLERERQGKKLSVIAENLRISEANLKAVEEGDTDAVPSDVYFRLFAKSYAEAIGIDYSATIEAIKEDIAANAEDPRRQRRKGAPSDEAAEAELGEIDEEPVEAPPSGTHWKAIGIAGAIVVILLGAYGVYNIFPSKTAENEETAAAPSNPAFATYNWNTPTYQPPDSLRLVLTPRGESWGTVLADGDTAVFRNMVPGRVYYAAAKYRIEMYVALPKVVDIQLNHHPISPLDPETGRNSRIEITQANVDSLLKAANANPPSTARPRPATPSPSTTTVERTSADTSGTSTDEL